MTNKKLYWYDFSCFVIAHLSLRGQPSRQIQFNVTQALTAPSIADAKFKGKIRIADECEESGLLLAQICSAKAIRRECV